MSTYFNSPGVSYNNPAPVDYSMGKGVYGSYADIRLKPKGGSSWRHPPSNVPLKKGPLFVPQGTPLPLADEVVPMEPPKDSMFIFANNVSSPLCCGSTYSTDTGCVCTTEAQRKLIAQQRGNNKNWPQNPPI